MSGSRNAKLKILKASGKKTAFSSRKLSRSLRNAGADPKTVKVVVEQVKRSISPQMNTKAIYDLSFRILSKISRTNAGRYKLKRAIMELGPTGFPFEKYIAALLQHEGYLVQTNLIIPGHCVPHEVDVIAEKQNRAKIIECKFHNQTGMRSDVKVPLYVHSRFNDIIRGPLIGTHSGKRKHVCCIITNTRFTTDAQKYAICSGIELFSWDYPEGDSIKNWIDRGGLYPITSLTSLTTGEKNILLDAGHVLARDIGRTRVLNRLDLTQNRRKKIQKEAAELCGD